MVVANTNEQNALLKFLNERDFFWSQIGRFVEKRRRVSLDKLGTMFLSPLSNEEKVDFHLKKKKKNNFERTKVAYYNTC